MKPEKRLRVFAAMIDKTKDGCWMWTGYLRHGYGVFLGQYAHRISYQMHTGNDPKAGVVHHTCQNRACVNPSHLQLFAPTREGHQQHKAADSAIDNATWGEFLRWRQRRTRRKVS